MPKFYTRSLGRRFAATLFDVFLIFAIAVLVSVPLAGPLSSYVRGGLGVYNETRCEKAPVYKSDGTQLLLDNWSKSVVCDVKSEGVFVSRTLVLQQRKALVRFDEFEIGTYYSVTVEVDDKNIIAKIVNITDIFVLILVFLFGFIDGSLGKTPGKWLFGLKVLSSDGTLPSIAQGIGRSAIKYMALFINLLIWATSSVLFGGHWILLLAGKGNVINADHVPGILLSVFAFFFFLVLLGIQASILLPWSKAGRAVYDRIAGTMVVRDF
jgi:uncharacterized RDD family membrane protein YckC